MTRPAHNAASRVAALMALIPSSPGLPAMLSSLRRSGQGARPTVRFSTLAKRQAMAGRKVTRDDLRAAAEKYKNWGKWGPDDEIGTLNYTSADDIIAAA